MRLIIESAIHASLKPLIAKEIVNFDCEVVLRKRNERCPYTFINSPPLLELDNGSVIFSPNVMCSYIFQKTKNTEEPICHLNWIEWENSVFQPFLCAILTSSYSGNKPDDIALNEFNNCLTKLRQALSEHKFLLGEELCAVDVVVWSSIYPLASNNKLCADYLSSHSSIIDWFNHLALEHAFQKAVEILGYTDQNVEKMKKSISAISIPITYPIDEKHRSSLTATKKAIISPVHLQLDNTSTTTTEDDEDHHISVSEEDVASAVQSFLHGRETAPPPREDTSPILPQEGVKNILITSALPYVNNVPHLGNIIGCVLSADAFARYCRLRNYNTLFISGTDEYGTATETKAMEENLTPREICDKYFKLHSEIYQWFEISFDYFGRTTSLQQTRIAQNIFWRLYERNYVLEDSVSQQFCIKCDRFLADRFIEGTCPLCGYDDARGDQCDSCGKLINAIELKLPRCKLCKATPVVKTSTHLFLDLPKLENSLTTWFDKSSQTGLWTSNAKNITQSWLKEGLKPRCITRDLKWGTPVPLENFTDKVFYVWFDAPIGYLSITANYTDEWERWWKNPSQVQLYQFMAKDNVPFHAVIFPSTQLGADDNYTIVNHLVATEYLNYEDGKFSKSRGVGVFGDQAKETGISADIWRFYLLYVRPESQDSVFSWSDLVLKNNSELLNNLGNFINRALAFLSNNFDGIIPDISLNDEDKLYLIYIVHHLNQYLDLLEKVRIREAIRHILKISRRGNQHIQNNKPWVLIKGTQDERARAGSVIALCANVACLLSVMIQPYMPTVSKTIQEQLNVPEECNVLMPQFICYLPPGHKIGKPSPLFQKIETKQVDELKKKFAGTRGSRETTPLPAERQIGKNDSLNKVSALADGHMTLAVEGLQAAIISQGDKVRQLKLNKAEKAVIQLEVAKLLQLKDQLKISTGQNPQNCTEKSKKKK